VAKKERKEFGKRGPPVVLHKPKPPGAPPAEGRKRSLAVSLAVMGALSLGAYETFDWIDRKLNCEPDPANPEELICKHRSGTTYRRYRSSGWRWSSHSSSSSSHGFLFGGFGHAGGFHFGGS
jgi:hypothetical protein